MRKYFTFLIGSLFSNSVLAAESQRHTLDLTHHWLGFLALAIFFIAYVFVMLEEQIHMRKSKPVLFGAGLIWILIAAYMGEQGMSSEVESAIRHNFLEYAELFFFLLVAMTYINAMMERGVFDIEAVKQANADLIGTIEESLAIADEGKARRAAAEAEMKKMEAELRDTLAAAKARKTGLGDTAATSVPPA